MIKRVKLTLPFLASLLVHLAAVLLVVALEPTLKSGGESDEQSLGSGSGKMTSGDIIPKQVEVELVEPEILTQAESPVVIPEQKKPVEGIPDCKSWYGGIGVYTRDLPNKTILTLVVAGYPADRAGLGSGDQIVSPAPGNIRGPAGSFVTLTVIRLGRVAPEVLVLVREKICEDRP